MSTYLRNASPAAAALAWILAGTADAQHFVRDGRPAAAIVLGAHATETELWAAEELRDHLRQMSGAELAISRLGANDIAAIDEPAVILGAAAVDAKLVRLEGLGEDGYVIRRAGKHLAVAGGRRGTLYGVYTLLEQMGVRWWTPRDTFVPKRETVPFPDADLRDVPKLEYRDQMFLEMIGPAGHLWTARNKMNGFRWEDPLPKLGGRYRFGGGNLVHSYNMLLRASGAPVHEEMKALVNGRRTDAQPCLSHPATFDAILAGVLKEFERVPDAHFVVVGQEDNRNYCRCPDCQRLIDAEGPSGPVIDFANRIAEAVEKVRPGAAICTAAYEWSRRPPKTLKPRPNVYITLCTIECDFARPLATSAGEVNTAFRRDLEAWGQITSKIIIWDYTTNYRAFLAPFPNLDVLVPNIKFFADHGAAGVFEQGAHTGNGSDFVGLKMWVMARALWNPEADAEALIREYCEGYYGPAAAAIREYLEVMHRPARTHDVPMGIYQLMSAPYYAAPVMADAAAALRKAEDAVRGDPERERRVRHAGLPLRYVLARRGPGSPTWKAIEAKIGRVDMRELAAVFQQTVTEQGATALAEGGEPVQPFVEWMTEYAAHAADRKVLPPELADKDPATFAVIQGVQFDGRARWFERTEGASDGWSVKQPGPAWVVLCAFAEGEHFTPGREYRLFVRARGTLRENADPSRRAWNYGVIRKSTYPARGDITGAQMNDGAWTVYASKPWTPANGDTFYFAVDPQMTPAVYIDCLWLEEVR